MLIITISMMIKNETIAINIFTTIALTFSMIITFIITTPITSAISNGGNVTLTVAIDDKIYIFISVAISTTFIEALMIMFLLLLMSLWKFTMLFSSELSSQLILMWQ